jgi:hypothetical protein
MLEFRGITDENEMSITHKKPEFSGFLLLPCVVSKLIKSDTPPEIFSKEEM